MDKKWKSLIWPWLEVEYFQYIRSILKLWKHVDKFAGVWKLWQCQSLAFWKCCGVTGQVSHPVNFLHFSPLLCFTGYSWSNVGLVLNEWEWTLSLNTLNHQIDFITRSTLIHTLISEFHVSFSLSFWNCIFIYIHMTLSPFCQYVIISGFTWFKSC